MRPVCLPTWVFVFPYNPILHIYFICPCPFRSHLDHITLSFSFFYFKSPIFLEWIHYITSSLLFLLSQSFFFGHRQQNTQELQHLQQLEQQQQYTKLTRLEPKGLESFLHLISHSLPGWLAWTSLCHAGIRRTNSPAHNILHFFVSSETRE